MPFNDPRPRKKGKSTFTGAPPKSRPSTFRSGDRSVKSTFRDPRPDVASDFEPEACDPVTEFERAGCNPAFPDIRILPPTNVRARVRRVHLLPPTNVRAVVRGSVYLLPPTNVVAKVRDTYLLPPTNVVARVTSAPSAPTLQLDGTLNSVTATVGRGLGGGIPSSFLVEIGTDPIPVDGSTWTALASKEVPAGGGDAVFTGLTGAVYHVRAVARNAAAVSPPTTGSIILNGWSAIPDLSLAKGHTTFVRLTDYYAISGATFNLVSSDSARVSIPASSGALFFIRAVEVGAATLTATATVVVNGVSTVHRTTFLCTVTGLVRLNPPTNVRAVLRTSAPGVPGLTARATSTSAIEATVIAPTSGDTPTMYQVELSTDSTFPATGLVTRERSDAGKVTFTGLQPSTTYHLRAKAANVAGSGVYSLTVMVQTQALVVAPGVPAIGMSVVSGSAIDVTATLPTSGDVPTSYEYQLSRLSDFSSGVTTKTRTTPGAARFTGLSKNVTYFARVRASNAGGTSAWSLSHSTKIPLAPGVPSVSLYQPSGTTTENWLYLETTDGSGGTPSSYELQLSRSSSFSSGVVSRTDLNGDHLFRGLVAGATYFARVRAINISGTSGWSSTDSASVAEAAPPPSTTTPRIISFSARLEDSRGNPTSTPGSNDRIYVGFRAVFEGASSWSITFLDPDDADNDDTFDSGSGLDPEERYTYEWGLRPDIRADNIRADFEGSERYDYEFAISGPGGDDSETDSVDITGTG